MLINLLRTAANDMREAVGERSLKFRDDLKDATADFAVSAPPYIAGITQAALAEVGAYQGKIENEFLDKSQAAMDRFQELSKNVQTRIDEAGAITAQRLDELAAALEAEENLTDADDDGDAGLDGAPES